MIGELFGKGGKGPAKGSDGLVKEATDQSFGVDVIEESRRQPVIVDFWAPWCGPCKQLGPLLERLVQAAGGAVKMVKINVDENPAYAGQLRVQSIPAVFAFKDGQPVDGFMGALPESQLKAFIDRLSGPSGPAADIEALFSHAAESLKLGDLGGAAQAFAQILSLDPDNAKAIAGLARLYLSNGDPERAAEVLAMAPEGLTDPELTAVRTALALAAKADGETAEFEARLAKDPDDHQARHDLAQVLAGRGQYEAAIDHLLTLVGRDRTWNDDGGRKALLTVFEAAGPTSEAVKSGRRRLSSLLFS